jgi:hypothetical protein
VVFGVLVFKLSVWCGAEGCVRFAGCCSSPQIIIQKPLVFERKILRRIFGPTKENQIWRIKTNEELDKSIKHKNIVNYIKAERLSWFGHVQRMPDTRTFKKTFNWKPLTKNHKEDSSTDGRITSNRTFDK